MSMRRSEWKLLPSILEEAVKEYNDWAYAHLSEIDIRNRIDQPLYHYTDAIGLDGIVKNQEVWFTSFKHLNDPTEIEYGMSIARELLNEIGEASDPRIKIFCDMVNELFTHYNMRTAFGIFVASFSRDGDDLGQWRGYGDNGRGFSLGLAPHLFQIVDKPDSEPHEKDIVSPVVYGKTAARKHFMPAIEKAIQIVGDAAEHSAELIQDTTIGMPFLNAMAKSLIASEMILNSLTEVDPGNWTGS